jgi:DNA-binding LacI/PurR family transcriptional regulator
MATIYDVARESGFSLSTVSNILNGSPKRVRPETRQRVQEAVAKLNYHPNAMARGLARQRTNALGILFGVVESTEIVINAYSAAILQAVLSIAAESSYDVTHVTRHWEGAARSLASFRDGRVDGLLVVAPPVDSDIVPALSSLDIPLVVVSWPQGRGDVLSVDIDDVHGARTVMDHLLRLGHRRIAHISGNPHLLSGQIRRQCFQEKMAEARLRVPAGYDLDGTYSVEAGLRQGLQLLRLPKPPTAVFAANDEIALGLVEAAKQLGVEIPRQLSIIGIDDRPFTTVVTPSITTLHQPFDEVGREATRLLIRLMRGEHVPLGTHLFSPRLIIRDSTAPPPGEAS